MQQFSEAVVSQQHCRRRPCLSSIAARLMNSGVVTLQMKNSKANALGFNLVSEVSLSMGKALFRSEIAPYYTTLNHIASCCTTVLLFERALSWQRVNWAIRIRRQNLDEKSCCCGIRVLTTPQWCITVSTPCDMPVHSSYLLRVHLA